MRHAILLASLGFTNHEDSSGDSYLLEWCLLLTKLTPGTGYRARAARAGPAHARPLRPWLFGLALTTASVLLCVAYVDRPVALYMDTHIRNTRLFPYLDDFFQVISATVPLALLTLFVCGCLALTRTRHPQWLEAPLICSWSMVWALAGTLMFKHMFGRTGADPEYVAEGKYEFSFMHGGPIIGGPGHDSFPSGTMAVAGSVIGVLWVAYPRLRGWWSTILVLTAVALVFANFHFVGDVISGAYLGLLIATLTLQLHRPTEHR